jgi:DNA polymerase-1
METTQKKRILIIDGNNNLYRAFFKNSGLTHKGQDVGGIYGFPRIMAGLIKRFNPHKVIICWDGGRSPGRMKIWPDYKKKTKTNLRTDYEDFYRQRNYVMEMMRHLGITQVIADKVEADDYIYLMRRIYIKKGYTCVIVSTDKDFTQVITRACSIWNENKGILIHHKNVSHVMGYSANETVDFLSLLGDKSDNIPGYPGIGEAKARDFLDKFGSIQSFLDDPEASYGKIDRKLLSEIYKRNSMLIGLRNYYYGGMTEKLVVRYYQKSKRPEINSKEFLNICNGFGMRSIATEEFISVFSTLKHD